MNSAIMDLVSASTAFAAALLDTVIKAHTASMELLLFPPLVSLLFNVLLQIDISILYQRTIDSHCMIFLLVTHRDGVGLFVDNGRGWQISQG